MRAYLWTSIAAYFLLFPQAYARLPDSARLERGADGALVVRWSGGTSVDVLVSNRAGQPASDARLVSRADADGMEALPDSPSRIYVLLRDNRKGTVMRVAERLLPLEKGSNFRDLGGYATSAGKHVRWGLIYRSGATPVLSDADLAKVRDLGLTAMVDLRSSEERRLAPTRIEGVPYMAVGYSLRQLIDWGGSRPDHGYGSMPTLLAPQVRQVFSHLVDGRGPLAFNCSAGQDRTGFTAALLLTALGVPRETILADYHLSTELRRPENEMPVIHPAVAAGDPIAGFFAALQKAGDSKPKPLRNAQGRSLLEFAFDEMTAKWGSVEGYMQAELGVGPAEIAQLRKLYTE